MNTFQRARLGLGATLLRRMPVRSPWRWHRSAKVAMRALCAGAWLVMAGAMAEPRTPFVPLPEAPRWGAIAATQPWYGYAYDHPTREAAEQAALAACAREVQRGTGGAGAAGTRKGAASAAPASPVATSGRTSPQACRVRLAFERSCGALAFGNYGEWGVADGATPDQASQTAVQQCNQHLPTEPCKVMVKVCAGRGAF